MLKEMQDNFKLAMTFRQNAVFCLETMLSSNGCTGSLNNTKEANVFNLIGICLYSKALIEIRKILEPYNKDKKANLSALVKYINDNQTCFIDKHYKDSLGRYINTNNNLTDDMKEFIKKRNEADALEDKIYCEKRIKLIIKMWDIFWKNLDNKYKFIRENRNIVVHSLSKTVTKFPSISKLYKVLRIASWFLKEIDFIMNNHSYGFESEKEQMSEISKMFWTRIE